MRLVLWLAVILMAAPLFADSAAPSIPLSEYARRRAAIRRDLKTVLVAFGTRSDEQEQLRTGFLQESYFYYLTGWTEPDAAVLLTKDSEEMFLPPRNERYERYYGHKTSPTDADAQAVTGFKRLLPVSELEREVFRLLGDGKTIEVIGSEPRAQGVRQLLTFRAGVGVEDATRRVDALREVKSGAEIAMLARSADVSVAAQSHAFALATAGRFEYQIAADMNKTWQDNGCEGPAYTPIVASGPNGIVLHYAANRRRMRSGDLVVMDAAAECSYYAADITRTVPVGGRFNARQREIYNIVLEAEKAAIAAVRPGMVIGRKETKGSLMQIAYDYINTHGKDARGETLGKYVLHGLSHHIGIDVHDPGDIMAPLKPGMVISVEPGVYIRDENIGVRIEDMVLVTQDGHRVLTQGLPKEAGEVEKLMQRQ
jgi:Xaa-Pro aminopeptidase